MIIHSQFFCCFVVFERNSSIGVVDLSTFGWGLVSGKIFRLSLTCFDGGVFYLIWIIVHGLFFCCFFGVERNYLNWCGGSICFWVGISAREEF